jgi:predicted SAM-dependent methyltransferase
MKFLTSASLRPFRSVKRRFVGLCSPVFRYHNYQKFKTLSKCLVIKLNLGSGPVPGIGGWTTVDYSGADISWDLRDSIPLSHSTVTAVYSSHLLEHLNFSEINYLLADINRILISGGKFRVCVPDARKYIEAYLQGLEFRNKNEMYEPGVANTDSFIDQVNYIAYMGHQHKFLFDQENLTSLLTKHNFSQIQLSQYSSVIDDTDRSDDSLYINCVKN